jgi:secreted trypsin-like serine protease
LILNNKTPTLHSTFYQSTTQKQNDVGGPLVFNTKVTDNPVTGSARKDKLVGLVSWGNGCGLNNKPTVYTRVSAFKDWIDCVVKGKGAWWVVGARGGRGARVRRCCG